MERKPRPFVAGNWKMNGLRSAIHEIETVGTRVAVTPTFAADIAICPPATLLGAIAGAGLPIAGGLMLGGQDCHAEAKGAHTGDVSAEMLRDAGARCVIVGHSERRADHGETDAEIAAKARAAWRAGLLAIICVGETLEEREAGRAVEVVTGQIDGSVPDGATAETTVIAYEPVWAIGTGKTPTVADIAEMHGAIRARLGDSFGAAAGAGMRILYGGSVKPENARLILGTADVDGALVGGASLKADDFLAIATVYA